MRDEILRFRDGRLSFLFLHFFPAWRWLPAWSMRLEELSYCTWPTTRSYGCDIVTNDHTRRSFHFSRLGFRRIKGASGYSCVLVLVLVQYLVLHRLCYNNSLAQAIIQGS